MPVKRMMLLCVNVAYLALLVFATFMPSSASSRDQWFWPVIAFVPVGVLLLLMLGRRRWWAAFAFSLLMAVWIEAAQSVWMPTGYAKLSDVAWSCIGAIAGIALAAMLTAPRSPLMRTHESHRVIAQAGHREIPQD
ncbi:VanZ family protein [Salinibacterium sp. G-O1]|uniref:VanZ family protein n=1 Tax=Salinibacterium sp. G-O1 TaxID=3046208 RepID=UPI0024BAC0A2|nr:VanZ family protein [Salinibacterium sp. G-O1]MDJ0335595.1 VanZ family protein [Salinibacterium sp. G-O1]